MKPSRVMRSPMRSPMREVSEIFSSIVSSAMEVLRRPGVTAHVWAPGANGVSVASLPSNNYLLSDGSTGYSTVDGVDGLTLDGMGVQSTLVALIDTFTFNPAGTTPPTTNSADTFLGVSCVSVTMPINAGGFGVCRGDGEGGAARHTITVGRFYQHTYSVALSRALTGAESVKIFTTGAMGSSELFVLTSANAANAWIDGASSIVATITGPDFPVVFANTAIAAPVTVYFRQYSVKEYTGTRLTQATTANKPLVRRGMLNLITQSASPNNAAWTKIGTAAAPNSTTVNLPAVNDGIYDAVTVSAAAGSIWTSAFVLSGTGTTTIGVIRTAGGGYEEVLSAITLTATPTLYAVTLTLVGAQTALAPVIVRKTAQTATTVTFDGGGLFAGTWTAAQILAEGGIPTTTATAASNPSAGKYWWSFNGSNNSLLSGNLGITNACTIVIAGVVNSLAANTKIFAEDTAGVEIYITTTGAIAFSKNGSANLVTTPAGVVVIGVPFVITCRLASGTAVVRKNGVQSATAASATTFTATTGARVGASFGGGQPLNGGLGWVVPSAVGLSDADCLTVERLAGSNFPGMATF